jgi:hypothetical protein
MAAFNRHRELHMASQRGAGEGARSSEHVNSQALKRADPSVCIEKVHESSSRRLASWFVRLAIVAYCWPNEHQRRRW